MAQDVNVKLNLPGIREVLKSSGVQAMLAERGERVKRAASANVGGNAFDKAQYRNGLSSEVQVHRVEAVARIGPTYKGGKRIEAKHGTLARSIGAASRSSTMTPGSGLNACSRMMAGCLIYPVWGRCPMILRVT